MGLLDTATLVYSRFSYGNTFSNPYSYSFGGYSGYSSYMPLFNYSSFSSYTPSYSYSTGASAYSFDFTPSSYSSYAPSSYAPSNYSAKNVKFGKFTFPRSTGALQTADLAQNALSYVGRVNSDREGNRLFSNGRNQAWCADFVTSVTRDTFGSKLPSSFGSSSVSGLQSWGRSHDCYLDVTSASDKAEYIAQNVKVGDIMIEKRGGKSHTGIVTKVNPDGSFETVEGNCSNKVKTRSYSANSSTLSGFVTLDSYVA